MVMVRSVHDDVPEFGANVAIDGAFDLHVSEGRVDVASHPAVYENVAVHGMYVILYRALYLDVTDRRRNVIIDTPSIRYDIADEPLLRCVCGERQEYDQAENHGGESEQRRSAHPNQRNGGVHASLARRRETARYIVARTRSMNAPIARTIKSA